MKINVVNSKKITAIGSEYDLIDYDGNSTAPVVGKCYFVYGRNNIMTKDKEDLYFTDNKNLLESGMPGNSNSNITRFHGWRGTDNNRSTNAYSVRKCLEVRKMKNDKVYIRFGSDLRKNEK